MNKPSSKIIQIVTNSTATLLRDGSILSQHVLTALCEDGSIWELSGIDKIWRPILIKN